jgi:5S rRNA maturation endonuclease (ribonuclease M5)
MKDLKQFLQEKYQVTAEEGKKVTCPMCKHDTLFLKKDGTIAKCFHPTCGWFVTAWAIEPRPSIHKLLEQLLTEWHYDLVNPATMELAAAYDYLTHKRKINYKVVEAAPIGVVPTTVDISERVLKMVLPMKEALSDSNTEEEAEMDSHLDWLTEKGRELDQLCKRIPGWLAFFYVDDRQRYCSIHFRKPDTKQFATFKPKKHMGVFGYDMFHPDMEPMNRLMNEHGIVVEGEFDCLKLQSVLACCKYDFANIIAVGGAGTADIHTIRKAVPRPVIIRDNDEAGMQLVNRINGSMHCDYCSPPAAFKDIDEFLNTFPDKYYFDALKVIKEMLKKRLMLLQPFEMIKEKINAIRLGIDPDTPFCDDGKPRRLKSFEINQRISQVIIDDMSRRGAFYNDSVNGYFLHRVTNKLLAIEKDAVDIISFLANYGLNWTEKSCQYVLEDLFIFALKYGKTAKISHFSAVKSFQSLHTVYLAMRNNKTLKITFDNMKIIDNGEDEVLFLSSPNSYTIPLIDEKMIDRIIQCPTDKCCDKPRESCDCDLGEEYRDFQFQKLLSKLLLNKFKFSSDRLTREQYHFLVKCWLMSFIFRDIIPARPILALIGPKGSGKTTALRLCGKVLCGDSWDVAPVSTDEKDFDSSITSKPLFGLDNVDGRIKWLNDKLAVVATGGNLEKRILHTTNQHKEFPIISTVALTSRTPMFRRDDIAERLQIVSLDRIDENEGSDFECESDILEEVMSQRTDIWLGLLRLIQNILFIYYDDILNEIKVPGARMQDFARFMAITGRALGCEDMAYKICAEQRAMQDDFTLENELVVEMLQEWLKIDGNAGREVTCAILNSELSELASQHRQKWPYKTTMSLAQKIRHIKSNLVSYVDLREVRKSTETIKYSFYPRDCSKSA